MNAKHTPGPWHVSENENGRHVIIKSNPNKVVAVSYQSTGLGTTPVCEANAKLIAAAPTMKEAIIEALHICRMLQSGFEVDHSEYGMLETICIEMEAAIKKATE